MPSSRLGSIVAETMLSQVVEFLLQPCLIRGRVDRPGSLTHFERRPATVAVPEGRLDPGVVVSFSGRELDHHGLLGGRHEEAANKDSSAQTGKSQSQRDEKVCRHDERQHVRDVAPGTTSFDTQADSPDG